jgi:hypothetical protein
MEKKYPARINPSPALIRKEPGCGSASMKGTVQRDGFG